MRRAAIVSPLRTPIGAYGGALRTVPVGELGAIVARAVVQRAGLDPARIDDVIFAHGHGAQGAAVGADGRAQGADDGGPSHTGSQLKTSAERSRS